MLLLDAYCGAGGAGMGYHRAGWTVIGVDHKRQRRYPFEFHLTDAIAFIRRHGREFDLIHASPPCQRYSCTRHLPHSHTRHHADLLPATRRAIRATGRPYVIENVPGAPLIDPIMLCGLTFDLKVFRHRLFETHPELLAPPHIRHGSRRIGTDGYCTVAGNGGSTRPVPARYRTRDHWRRAMGIDWMSCRQLAQAVPPAYTQWIGEQMIAILEQHTCLTQAPRP